jgi:hypothetical protein
MKVFEYQGARYDSLKDIAQVRGVRQVNRRDFERLGITEVEVAPESSTNPTTEPTNPNPEPPKAETPKAPQDSTSEPEPPQNDNKKEPEPPAPSEPPLDASVQKRAEELQKKYGYTDVNHLGAELKKMEGAAVIALAKEIGLSWNEQSHHGINRMRAAMAIRAAVFPGERRDRAPKSAWKSMSLEDIVKLCKKNKLKFRETIDDKVTRMWAIKALNDAGITPPQ